MPLSRFVYDPWEIPPEQRRATIVGRGPILDRLIAAIREQEDRATVQHYILTGPRGMGKTSLLLMLRDRIRQEPEISAKWFCVQLREEEYYIHRQRDLWQLVMEALADQEKVAEAQQVVNQAKDIRDEEKSSALLVDGLRSICQRHGKRLALLIDNFGQIFPTTAAGEAKHRKPDSEYRAFRKRLSTETFLMLIATSVKLFQDIYAYDKGFFHFFSPVELPELTQEEFVEMLRRLGEADENKGFVSRLDQSRVNHRTLYFLTGGNPRFVTVLYQILAQNELSEPVQALWETVAGLTPMLRHELADMPRQQSKALDALLRRNGVATPAEIADTSRLPLNVVTTQLGRLKEARYVTLQGGGKGKKATYRIADQMFSVWYWMRYVPVARRRIELFTDFIRAWYSMEERKRLFRERLERFQAYRSRGFDGLARKSLQDAEYYAASFDDPAESRLEMERIADAYVMVGDWSSAAGLFAEISGTNVRSLMKFESMGYSGLADHLAKKGDLDRALKSYSEAVAKDPYNFQARAAFGLCLAQSGNHARAKEEFDQILGAFGADVATRVLALTGRSVARLSLGDATGALADWTVLAGLPSAPKEVVAGAYVLRGLAKIQSGDANSAIADWTVVADLPGAPKEVVAGARLCRGLAKTELGDAKGAIEDLSALLEMDDTPAQLRMQALFLRGVAKVQVGDPQGAIADCTAVMEVEGAPGDEVAGAYVIRGAAKGIIGDFAGARDDCASALEVTGIPAKFAVVALALRGRAAEELGNIQAAIADYTAAAALKDAPKEAVAMVLLSQGAARARLNDHDGAIKDYTAVAELEGVTADRVAEALLKRAKAKGRSGNLEGVVADCTAVLEVDHAPSERIADALTLRGRVYGILGRHQEAVRDLSELLKLASTPDDVRKEAIFHRAVAHEKLGNLEQALIDYTNSVEASNISLVHRGIRSAVRLLLSMKRSHEALEWVRRLHELEPHEATLDARLQARVGVVVVACNVSSLEDAAILLDALLDSDPPELRDRLRFFKPFLELARTKDESVLANLPEDERKMAREIARTLAEAARPPVDAPGTSAGDTAPESADGMH